MANKDSSGKYRGVCLRPDLRLAIYLRDRFTCVYCLADLHGAHQMDITLDHLTPDSAGGSNAPANLVTACRACNCSRQDKPLSRFASPEARAHIRRPGGRLVAVPTRATDGRQNNTPARANERKRL